MILLYHILYLRWRDSVLASLPTDLMTWEIPQIKNIILDMCKQYVETDDQAYKSCLQEKKSYIKKGQIFYILWYAASITITLTVMNQ